MKKLSGIFIYVFFVVLAVLCLQEGRGNVTAYAAESRSVSSKYRISKTSKNTTKGKSFVLKVTGGTGKVTWSSGSKSIACITSVKKSGRTSTARVYARAAGICTIYARVSNVTTLSCVVSVNKKKALRGTFKNGVYYSASGTKLYSIKKTLSSGTYRKDFGGAKYLYIGASRTRCTRDAVNDPDVYFAAYSGGGITCLFESTFQSGKKLSPGLTVIDSFLTQKPGGTVLIDFGGNDTRNIRAYIGLYRNLIKRYPSAKFWFIGILPREDGTNAKRIRFNARLKKAFPSRVIDLYSFVINHDMFETYDGIHYGPVLSRIIYEKTMSKAGRKIGVNYVTGDVTVK